MDISSIASAASAISQNQTGDAVSISVLKKALDIQAQTAAQLIQALPQVTTNSPAHLGSSVNTFA